MRNIEIPIEKAVKHFPSIRRTVKIAKENGLNIITDKPIRNSSGRIIDHELKLKTSEGYQIMNKAAVMLMLLICLT